MKVLVTGSNGFAAKHVISVLKERGHNVKLWDYREPQKQADPNKDLAKEEIAEEAVGDCDAIIHLAGIPHPAPWHSEAFFRNNIQATHNLVKIATDKKLHKFVYSSSTAFYGTDANFVPLYLPIDEEHPPNMRLTDVELDSKGCSYPASKQAVEAILEMYGRHQSTKYQNNISIVVLRMGPLVRAQLLKSLCAFTDPRDIGDAFEKALHYDCDYEVFNILTQYFPENYKIENLLPLEWIKQRYPEILLQNSYFDTGLETFFSSQKAITKLGWSPQYP